MKTKLLKKVRKAYDVRYTEDQIKLMSRGGLSFHGINTEFKPFTDNGWSYFWRCSKLVSYWEIEKHDELLKKRINRKLFVK